jgi:propanol-preferring alcohol dehydrogenase
MGDAKFDIPKDMKAFVVTDFKKPMELKTIPVPEPGFGQVLIKLTMTGVCHSDVHILDNEFPITPELPLVVGHEGEPKNELYTWCYQ